MPAPKEIRQLIDRFERNLDDYRSPGYPEAQVRIEFINPLFQCLGWDIDNTQGFAEWYKDVIHELIVEYRTLVVYAIGIPADGLDSKVRGRGESQLAR